jgi:hypothetical protein
VAHGKVDISGLFAHAAIVDEPIARHAAVWAKLQ